MKHTIPAELRVAEALGQKRAQAKRKRGILNAVFSECPGDLKEGGLVISDGVFRNQ